MKQSLSLLAALTDSKLDSNTGRKSLSLLAALADKIYMVVYEQKFGVIGDIDRQ